MMDMVLMIHQHHVQGKTQRDYFFLGFYPVYQKLDETRHSSFVRSMSKKSSRYITGKWPLNPKNVIAYCSNFVNTKGAI